MNKKKKVMTSEVSEASERSHCVVAKQPTYIIAGVMSC